MMTTQVRKIVMNTRPPETYRILRMSRMRSPALWVSAEADLTSSASAHAKHVAPDAHLLAAEIAATRPLAVVMAESVASLREWAKDRTVPAD